MSSVLNKGAHWCNKHNCAFTGFSTLYCGKCEMEKEAAAKFRPDPDMSEDNKIWQDVRPGEGWTKMPTPSLTPAAKPIVTFRPQVPSNWPTSKPPLPFVSPFTAPTSGAWEYEGTVLAYQGWVGGPRQPNYHIFEVDLLVNRRGARGLTIAYIKDIDMVEIAKDYVCMNILMDGLYITPGDPFATQVWPPHKSTTISGINVNRHKIY